MFLEHPIGTLFTDLLTADEISQPEVAYWHTAQEEMERYAFSGVAYRRICAQIKTVQKKQVSLKVLADIPVIDKEILDLVMESDSAISAVGAQGMSHEISPGVKRVVVNQGVVKDFLPVVQSSFDNDLYDKVASRPSHLGAFPILPKGPTNRAELDAIFDQPEEDHLDDRSAVRPSYLGRTSSVQTGPVSREELDAILDGPDVSILDEDESDQKKGKRVAPQLSTTETQAKASAHSAVEDGVHDEKKKKQKFVQKGRDFGHGGRSDRKRGRNGPTGFH